MSGGIRAWLKRIPGIQHLAWMYHVKAIIAERDHLVTERGRLIADHGHLIAERDRLDARVRGLDATRAAEQSDPALLIARLPEGAWLWGDLELRRRIQAHGVNLVSTNFYSNTPSIADIEGSFEYAAGDPPYALPLDDSQLDAELASLKPYAADFSAPWDDRATGRTSGITGCSTAPTPWSITAT